MNPIFQSIQQDFSVLSNPTSTAHETLIAAEDLCSKCLHLLHQATHHHQGYTTKGGYDIFQRGNDISRPISQTIFIDDVNIFKEKWDYAITINNIPQATNFQSWNEILYTASMAFACVYDLYQSRSRKTPGTFFEIVVTNLLRNITGRPTRKYISLNKPGYNVTTDIVLISPNPVVPHLVVPCKITTRERISQAFVYQRILDSVFPGRYKTVFIGISEMQRNGSIGVNEICVPIQIDLFNSYVAHIEGLYYADLPDGYKNLPNVRTGNLTDLLIKDLPQLL